MATELTIKARPSNLPGGKKGFILWAKKAMPDLHRAIQSHAPQALSGLGDDTDFATPFMSIPISMTSDYGSTGASGPPSVSAATTTAATAPADSGWISTIKNIANAVIPIYQQKKVVDLQLDRAKAGLPPLDVKNLSAIGDSAAYKVGVDSSTQNTLLIVAGIAVAGLIGWTLLRRK